MNNLVEIVNLTKKYGTNVAVNHLTVSLPKGKIIGLLGPNGSGKSNDPDQNAERSADTDGRNHSDRWQ